MLLLGVISPLPNAVFLSNTQSDTVKSDPATKIPAPYNPPFSLKVEPETVKVFTSSPAIKAPEVVIAPPQRPALLTKQESEIVASPIVATAPTKQSPFL